MDSGQYQHPPQAHGLPLDFPYDGSSASSSDPAHHMPSFDGLPRTQPDPQLMNTWPSTFYNYNLAAAMPAAQGSTEWIPPSHTSPIFDDQTANACYGYSPNVAGSNHDGPFLRDQYVGGVPSVPRTWIPYDAGVLSDNTIPPKAYKPSSYMIEPTREELKTYGLPYGNHDSSGDFARLSINRSPKIEDDNTDKCSGPFSRLPPFRMPASESSDDSPPCSREMTAMEVEDHGVDEPYAKLIYRALMSAPDHAMVLQEIYQWFRDNTTKGSSDTKGWMNSIRHNLSMNAVRYWWSSLLLESCAYN